MPAQTTATLSATDTRRTLLRISNRSTQASFIPLSGQRVVLGRAEDVNVPLESGKVSRQHAELFKDPFDRWWVRDLGSRNGTRVNGTRISESILQPGDVLEVGDFVLSLCPMTPGLDQTTVAPPRRASYLTVHDDAGDQVRSLREFAAPKIGAAHLSAVTEFGHRLNITQDPGERLRALCDLMLSGEFHGRTAVVLRAPRGTPERAEVIYGPATATGPGGEATVAPPVSRSVLRAVCHAPEPVMANNLSTGPTNVELSIPADVMAMSVFAVPLRFDEKTVELLYVVLDPQYGHSDWLALAALSVKHYQHAEAVWLNVDKIRQYAAVERELEKAQEIQMRLIPRQVAIPHLAWAVGFRPCYWVAGDHADVLTLADGRIMLAIADVCGKGLSAALGASAVHTMIHANVRAGKDMVAVINDLNQYLVEDLGGNSFVSMVCISLDPATGALECINSGHPPALVVGPAGQTRELQSLANPPLGVDPAAPKVQRDSIAKGELLVLFTDGLTELNNPARDMLTLEGLTKGLCDIYCGEPGAAVPALAERLTSFLDGYQHGAMAADDRTFLLARME